MEKVDVCNLPAQGTAVVLTDTRLLAGIVLKNKISVHSNVVYHKFSVHNVSDYTRDFILGTIIQHCLPHDLIPVGYHEKRSTNTVLFFAKGCGASIEKLCKDNLLVPNPKDSKYPFKLKITLNYTTAVILGPIVRDINKNLNTVLTNSFDSSTRHLDLSNFHSRKELLEFTPLFVPRILSHILNMSKSLFVNIKSIDLSDNSLANLEPFELLWGSNILSLNLNKNELKSIAPLGTLRHIKLKELYLDGNPLCKDFDEVTYIQKMKQLVPTLEKLDGVVLGPNSFLPYKKNYLWNKDGFDFVDQFINKFFTMYDCNNRQFLEKIYHKNAMFSLTAVYLPGQATSITAQMKDYKMHARNLTSLVDYSRSSQFLFRGVSAIMSIFSKLPQSEHDFCSFDIDLLSYTETKAILVVHGVFREPAKSLLDTERFLGFSRNFVLEHNNGQFCIVNEQLHVYNALTSQKLNSFKFAKPRVEFGLPPPETPEEKQQLISAVQVITTLNPEWSKKLLEECYYDLRKTLTLFVELYKVDKILKEAFVVKEEPANKPANKPAVTNLGDSQSEYPFSDNVKSKTLPLEDISVGSDDLEERQMELSEISSEGKGPQASDISSDNEAADVIDISSDEGLNSSSGKKATNANKRNLCQNKEPTIQNTVNVVPNIAGSTTQKTPLAAKKVTAQASTVQKQINASIRVFDFVNNKQRGKRTRKKKLRKKKLQEALIQVKQQPMVVTKPREQTPELEEEAPKAFQPKKMCLRCGAAFDIHATCPCFRHDFIDNCKYWLSRIEKHN